ncbi:protein enabled isoform X1 [Bactrocera neohumeralis]|uniref:protein enabled isoform X1 n=1 Tax=Bactrocera neohumeralis TaxID=98809 RepID=UPI002166682E|nr:protein enabled isoform X1 [Bactrocera neohumeralis]
MKKLYAKASFKSKKPSNKNVNEDCVDGDIYINKSQHGPIILAYQSGPAQQQDQQNPADIDVNTATMRRKHRKSTSEVAQSAANATAASNADESFFPPPPSRTPSSASSLSASNPAIARLYQPDDSHYYYSIQELQQLNMLDHRHPHFHRHQQHQLLHQSNSASASATAAAAATTTFYEHHKLVLHLPMAATTATAASPIYEAPQIVNNANEGGGGARSLDYNYNAHHPAPRSYLAAGGIDGHDLDKDNDFMMDSDGRIAGFGSLPIVEAAINARRLGSSPPSSTSHRSSTLSFNNARKLQHTHSMPSICVRSDRSAGVEDNADDDYDGYEIGALQQLHEYRQQQQQQMQQQQAQHNQHFHPQPSRHNSVKANLISNWPTTANAGYISEQSIIGARASVMVYDDNLKRWLPSGTSAGLSKVQIYHHQQNNTFRIVGRKLQDHEVVINCSILKGLKYNQATPTFHQWRDSKFVYGLNFSSQHDAEAFARAMVHALDVLSGRLANNPVMGGAMGMGGLPTNGNGFEEDMGYRTMTSEDAAILRQQQQITGQITPSAQTPTSQANQNNIPQSPPTPQGHHRTSRNSLSAPAAPQPQQMTIPQQQPQPPYGQAGQPNGLQQQTHIPPVPGQPQYHAPQQMQQAPQASHVYSAQQLVNAGYPPQSQYQPSHFMLSNSNPNLNLHQYSQQQQPPPQCIPGAPQPPMPPPHQNGIGGGGGGSGPIYVSSSQSQPALPTSVSSSSGVYGGQPMQMQQPPQQAPSGVMQNGGGSGGVGVAAAAGAAAAPPPPPPPPFGGIGAPAPPMMGGSSVPPAPMPPPANVNRSAPQAPAAPPPPPAAAAAPPPPPPPPAGGAPSSKKDDPQADLMGSLAAQLQQAKLKKNKPSAAPTENSGSSTSSGGSGNYGTIGRSSTGMASMMDEMAKTLARRRAQAEKKEPEVEPEVKQRPWEKSNTLPHKLGSSSSNTNCNASSNNTSNSGSESPRPMRKRFGSASEETILKQVNGDGLSLALSSTELDTLKADILKEIRSEIQKVKQEIIEVIKSEFNRR